jgi:ParB family transcriptional regulator, chromosome partitioning protein
MMEATIAKRRALGRGLGALIPTDLGTEIAAVVEPQAPAVLPLSSIHTNPNQPRRTFEPAAIAELAASIREKGILQPLLVRPHQGMYQLIAGERRFRAALEAGLEHVPVVVRDVEDTEMLELALIENIQREELNPMEEAAAYGRLLDEFNLTQQQIADRVSKDRSTIANTLRLLSLPEEVRREIEAGRLSAGHARALMALEFDTAKIALAGEIIEKRLTVRQAEQMAKVRREAQPDLETQACERRLTEKLGTKVKISSKRNGSGKLEVTYYSLEQLNELIDRLGRV